MDVKYAETEELYATIDIQDPHNTNIEPIGIDEQLQAQLHYQCFAEVR